ncbi:MAG: S41 family peptidase [Cyclobacteriaceae bacterium]|nr:S41 family peptidase [Cyclobacteriaceae bacterium]
MGKFNKTAAAILITALALAGIWAFTSPGEKYFEITKNLDIFATLYKEVNTYYVDEVSPNQLIKTGIDAMLGSLDPYTNYIPEDDIEDYRTMTTGQYGGIGALIGTRNGKNMIIMPYEGFPAHKAGLKIGDEIIQVNGIDVKRKAYTDISKLLRGQANSSLKMVVQRHNSTEPIEVEIVREKITIDNVPYYGLIDDDIGYVKLSDFTTNAGKEVKNAVIELKSQGANSIILDLRGNPGGLLNEAVNVSNIFIPKGSEVVSTKGKMKDWNKTYKALNPPVDTEIPVAVLISSSSASASEIVAGVVQDYDRGILVGQKTFGKGLVQATRPLTYNSQLKVTTAKYYIPSGRCIQAIDYSSRNDDGSVGKVPDSLKVAFKTRNGRTVFDGGGVDPDISVDIDYLPPIVVSLISKGLIFDYATIYHYSHETIGKPRDFKLADSDYQKFISWLSDKDYDYTTRVENSIDELIAQAKKEKYYDDISKQILVLRSNVEHNKDSDLQKFKADIKQILEEEISSRYYLSRGVIETSFSADDDVKAAVKALRDSQNYGELLEN